MNLQVILGNFALILFVLMVLTGLVWCLDVFYLSKQRRKAADRALAEFDARQSKLAAEGISAGAGATASGLSDGSTGSGLGSCSGSANWRAF